MDTRQLHPTAVTVLPPLGRPTGTPGPGGPAPSPRGPIASERKFIAVPSARTIANAAELASANCDGPWRPRSRRGSVTVATPNYVLCCHLRLSLCPPGRI